jgi:RNA polymerase sigma factor (sigma-70 family)
LLNLLLRLTVVLVATAAAVIRRDTEILRGALAGDARARRDLVEQLMPIIRARVRRIIARRGRTTLSDSDADDLSQEVWFTLVKDDARQLRQWSADHGATLGGYVGMIAEREAGNHIQRLRALKRGGDQERVGDDDALGRVAGGEDPAEQVAAQDLAAKLSAHLESTLSDTGRAVMRYLYTDKRSASEVAKIMGMKPNAVYIWQHRIRAAAKAFLDEAEAV